MPPFNNRRFDPYGNGVGGGTIHPTNTNSNSNSNSNHPNHHSPHGPLAPTTRPSVLGRTRTLLTSGGGPTGAGRTAGYYGGLASNGGGYGGGGGGGGNFSSFSPSGAAAAAAATLRPRGRRMAADSPYVDGGYRDERDAYHDVAGPYGRSGGMQATLGNGNGNGTALANRRFGAVGAAPLSSHVHPLLASRARGRTAGAAYAYGGRDDFHDDDVDDDDSFDGAGRPFSPSRRPRPRSKSRGRRPSPLQRRLAHWILQSKRILSLLLGQIPEADALALQTHRQRQKHDDDDRDDADPVLNSHGETEEEILLHLLSAKSTARILRLFLLLPLLYHVSRAVLPPTVDRLTRPKPWSWSASDGSLSSPAGRHRNLAGRNCVMNYFIEKQPPDEYNPDYVEAKPKSSNDKDGKDGADSHNGPTSPAAPVVVVEGTYRTKGQVHVISRFIEAIADSFRSNTKIRQHLIFAESRDGGHLAHEAIRHWPPRGKFKTMVHVLASEDLPFFEKDGDPDDVETRTVARALGYGALEDIELKFRGNDKARVYDRDGNLAGLPATEGVDDDEVDGLEEMDVPDKETLEFRIRSGKRRRRNAALDDSNFDSNSTVTSYGYVLPPGIKPYPNLRALLPFEDEDDGEGDIVVPYLHVDGVSMGHQMAVLEAARSLLEDQTVVVVGLEHSPDLDVRILIEFFRQVGYKTFFLGARQIARIDNLCEEVLDDVLEHPSVSAPKAGFWRRAFMKLGWISKDELRIVAVDPKKRKREIARELKLELASRISGEGGSFGPKRRETPPFFVAMPRGRRSKEEMTIQHMYDLFGGYGGGGGQIKTANDRKAPGK